MFLRVGVSWKLICMLALAQAASLQASFSAQTISEAKPIDRTFVVGATERYRITIDVKAETQSVATERIAANTYVTPVFHKAEARAAWRVTRRFLSLRTGGSAEIAEASAPEGACEMVHQPDENQDPNLQSSLARLCTKLQAERSVRYTEDREGLLNDSGAAGFSVDLGEIAPPLLRLWLRRAISPNLVFPKIPLQPGAKSIQALRPSSQFLKNAQGSESTEWLEAQSDVPAASLHVVQQLSWDSAPQTTPAASAISRSNAAPPYEAFFSDSLITLSLLDGSVLRANRSASRKTTHKMEPVPGLPEPPEFSSKLTISITVERLP